MPPDADLAEYWTCKLLSRSSTSSHNMANMSQPTDKPRGGKLPWFMRAARHGGRFWEHERPINIDENEKDGANSGRPVERLGSSTESEMGLKNGGAARGIVEEVGMKDLRGGRY